jgi:geranylgeranylglyceryl phosphate synthase family protein
MRPEKFPNERSVALLLDPDKANDDSLRKILEIADNCKADFIFAGGSLTFTGIDNLIDRTRRLSSIPIVLFPGNLLQLTKKADKILLLSLISGRNPELLIGNHVIAAPHLKDIREKLIPAGYILVSVGPKTSVEYVSQTDAIPSDKTEIAVATALAGEMLGLRMIYLEAGSGAARHVPTEMIRSVHENISVPLAVGGGIKSAGEVREIFTAGADLIVLGNSCEKNPDLLSEACMIRDEFRKTDNLPG